MNRLRFAIDCRGLTLEQKKEIWAHYWNRASLPEILFAKLQDTDTIIYVYEAGSNFNGDIARDASRAIAHPQLYDGCSKPIFSPPVFLRIEHPKPPEPKWEQPHRKFCIDGVEYHLVPVVK